MLLKPELNEYNPHFEGYISLVPEGDLIEILKTQLNESSSFFKSISKEKSEYRYAEGKWSIKEVIGHLTDTERIMCYRLLAIARGDQAPLPSFDENSYNENADFNRLEQEQLIHEYTIVRQATLSLLSILSDESFTKFGMVLNSPTTPRALAYIIAGHELHHLKIINERYL
ncbi:DinB family protein [Gottfriedia luciferensis]|uniref:DinB family protein n=1 Tax=Gottfriedia luciferensis TaxID=178774 RepID=UPI000B44EA6A|nr:DinB family protein [Gottfriedia luciferensis]